MIFSTTSTGIVTGAAISATKNRVLRAINVWIANVCLSFLSHPISYSILMLKTNDNNTFK